MPKPSTWIQDLERGALTKWAKRNRKVLESKIGMNIFTKKGDLNDIAFRKILKEHEKGSIKLSNTTVKRIRTKFKLDELRRKRKIY